LVTPKLGEPLEPSRAEDPDPWWRAVSSRDVGEPDAVVAVAESEAPVEFMPD
jgi:hypothetical protein